MKLKLSKPHGRDSKAWQVLKGLEQFESAEGVNTVWGLGSGNYDLIRKSKNFLFTDMPYWNRYNPQMPDGEYNWRMCVNAIHVNKIFDLPNDRSKHIQLKDWRESGEYILVAPSSPTIHRYINKTNWLEETVSKLKNITDLPIKIRNKPRGKGTSGPHVADVPLQQDLDKAKYVVTSCSVVGVESVIEGIPTFCEPQAACAPVSNTDIFSLEPKKPERQMWINTLSYHQWTPSEIAQGKFVDTYKNLYGDILNA